MATSVEVAELDQVASEVVTRKGPRNLIFISHATHEDDAFSIWLAAQLAIAGYTVWCDATKLLGGEKFWHDIEDAIRQYACKVLYVSTLAASNKGGTQKELRIAFETKAQNGLKDFVVPLRIDAFPFESMSPAIRELNCIDFGESWANGLEQLLKLLEREQVPKVENSGPAAVAEWHRRSQDARRTYVVDDEVCYSNWFKIRLPQNINLHCYSGPENALVALTKNLALPHRSLGRYLISFAEREELEVALGADAAFSETLTVETLDFANEGFDAASIASQEGFNIVSDLCRQAWERAMDDKRLGTFELASGLRARFFPHGRLEKDRAYFQPKRGRRTYRQVVGRKSKRTLDGEKVPDGFWHYAVSASVQIGPFPRIVLRHHVIFTDDGEHPWASPDRMHKARRSVCKQWWNKEWRDRLFALMAEISGGEKVITLPVSSRHAVAMLSHAMEFTSPWTYYEDRDEGLDETHDIELVEDETTDDEGEDVEPPA